MEEAKGCPYCGGKLTVIVTREAHEAVAQTGGTTTGDSDVFEFFYRALGMTRETAIKAMTDNGTTWEDLPRWQEAFRAAQVKYGVKEAVSFVRSQAIRNRLPMDTPAMEQPRASGRVAQGVLERLSPEARAALRRDGQA